MQAANDVCPHTLSPHVVGVHILADDAVVFSLPFGVLVPHVGLPARVGGKISAFVNAKFPVLMHALADASILASVQFAPAMPICVWHVHDPLAAHAVQWHAPLAMPAS